MEKRKRTAAAVFIRNIIQIDVSLRKGEGEEIRSDGI